ncbi:hypothetical protein [Sphingopyxis sp.]|uniref:hypothetical protein n=1 Tax=Sphingopyxis sp. TaxID=1908224 RepID=UPI002EDAA84C
MLGVNRLTLALGVAAALGAGRAEACAHRSRQFLFDPAARDFPRNRDMQPARIARSGAHYDYWRKREAEFLSGTDDFAFAGVVWLKDERPGRYVPLLVGRWSLSCSDLDFGLSDIDGRFLTGRTQLLNGIDVFIAAHRDTRTGIFRTGRQFEVEEAKESTQ